MTPCDRPPTLGYQTSLCNSNPGNLIRQVFCSAGRQYEASHRPSTISGLAHSEHSNAVFGNQVHLSTAWLRSPRRYCSGDGDVKGNAHDLLDPRAETHELINSECRFLKSRDHGIRDLGIYNSWSRCKESPFSASPASFEMQLSHHANVTIRDSLSETIPFLRDLRRNGRSCKTSLLIKLNSIVSHRDELEGDDRRGNRSAGGAHLTHCGESTVLGGAMPTAVVGEQPLSFNEVSTNIRWIEYVRHGLKAHVAADRHVSRTGIVSNLKIGNEYICMPSPNAMVTEIMASALDRAQMLISSAQSSAQKAAMRESIAHSQAVEAAARAVDAEMWAMDAESRAMQYERRANDAELAARAARSEQNVVEQHALRAQEQTQRAQAQAECDRQLLSAARTEACNERRKRRDAEAVARDLESAMESEIEARFLAEQQSDADRAALQKLHELELRAVNAEEKSTKYCFELLEAREQEKSYLAALDKVENELVRANRETKKCMKAQLETDKIVGIYLRSLKDAQSVTEKTEEEVNQLREALDNAEENISKAKEKNSRYRVARQEAESQAKEIKEELDRCAEALERANRKTWKAETKAEKYRIASEDAQNEADNAIEKAKRNKSAQRATEKRLEEVEGELGWYIDALKKANRRVKKAEALVEDYFDELEEMRKQMLRKEAKVKAR